MGRVRGGLTKGALELVPWRLGSQLSSNETQYVQELVSGLICMTLINLLHASQILITVIRPELIIYDTVY